MGKLRKQRSNDSLMLFFRETLSNKIIIKIAIVFYFCMKIEQATIQPMMLGVE